MNKYLDSISNPHFKIPSPDKTLLIVTGASDWPEIPTIHKLHESEPYLTRAYKNSAQGIVEYFTNIYRFNINEDNILNIFDKNVDFFKSMETFFKKKGLSPGKKAENYNDIIFFYIGHGFLAEDGKYCFPLNNTSLDFLIRTGISPSHLDDFFYHYCGFMRKFFFFDCCFAEEIPYYFKPRRLISVNRNRNAGIAFFWISGTENITKIRSDLTKTTLSSALLKALNTGSREYEEYMTLHELRDLVAEIIERENPIENGERNWPDITKHDHGGGDITEVHIFPNIAVLADNNKIPKLRTVIVADSESSSQKEIVEMVRHLQFQEYTTLTIEDTLKAIIRGKGHRIVIKSTLVSLQNKDILYLLNRIHDEGTKIPTIIFLEDTEKNDFVEELLKYDFIYLIMYIRDILDREDQINLALHSPKRPKQIFFPNNEM